jgi:hypothetical protein
MNKIFNPFTLFKRNCHQHVKKSFPTMQYLNNHGFTSCKKCIHYIESIEKCNRFIKHNFTSGNIEFASINICRSHLDLCGPEARYKVLDIDGKFLGP